MHLIVLKTIGAGFRNHADILAVGKVKSSSTFQIGFSAGLFLALTIYIQASVVSAADNFWQVPQANLITRSSDNSALQESELSASLDTSHQADRNGRQTGQIALKLTKGFTDTSSYTFEYAQAVDQRNFTFGYTNNNLSTSFMRGSGEDYSRLAGNYTGVDPYLFHGGYKQEFESHGYALDYNFGNYGHLQFGQAIVKADGLASRRARYLEWSNSAVYARAMHFERGNESLGNGLDVGFAVGRRGNKLLAVQTMQLDNDRSMQRIRFQLNGQKSRQYWIDLSSQQNPLFEANDDYRFMFSFKTLLGTGSIASYQNDGGNTSDEAAIEDETGGPPVAKKSGRGWKRAVFIGVGVAAAAGLSSSGSSSQDNNMRFRTQNEAAFDVLNGVNPRSISENREYGGWVFVNQDGNYSSTAPIQGEAASVQLPDRNLVIPAGSRSTATYHTHAAFDPRFDNENFSPNDLESDSLIGVDGYLATPGGQFKYHDVSTGSVSTLGTIATTGG